MPTVFGRIQVKTCGTGLREQGCHLRLDLLGSETPATESVARAFGADRRHLITASAVVAGCGVQCLMEGKAHVAAVTFLYPSAVGTLHRSGISAAVVEQYHLSVVIKGLPHVLNQLR